VAFLTIDVAFFTRDNLATWKGIYCKELQLQGLVFMPTLFNIYWRCLQDTRLKFSYANEWALLHQSNELIEVEQRCPTTLQNTIGSSKGAACN